MFEIPFSVSPTNPVHVDARYGPWADAASAYAGVARPVRVAGLTVLLSGQGEYWWPGPGLDDADLVAKLPATPPTTGNGSASRGTYLSLPGRYTAANYAHALPAGTKDVDLKWGSGRALEPGTDYLLDTDADPPTATIVASLAQYGNERIWGRSYRVAARTYLALPGRYGVGYQPQELPAGTADVGVFWGSGRELEPGIDYTFEPTSRALTLLADPAIFGGERLWLWLYS